MSETFSYSDLRSKPVVALQRSIISVGHRDIAGLHSDQFPVSLEINPGVGLWAHTLDTCVPSRMYNMMRKTQNQTREAEHGAKR